MESVLSAVSEEEFPLVFAFREALLSGEGDIRSEWALNVILDGIVGGQPPGRTLRNPSRNSKARGG